MHPNEMQLRKAGMHPGWFLLSLYILFLYVTGGPQVPAPGKEHNGVTGKTGVPFWVLVTEGPKTGLKRKIKEHFIYSSLDEK